MTLKLGVWSLNITTFSVSGLVLVAGIADSGNVYGMNLTRTTYRGWKYTTAGVLSFFNDPAAALMGSQPACVSSSGRVVETYFDSQGMVQDFEMSH